MLPDFKNGNLTSSLVKLGFATFVAVFLINYMVNTQDRKMDLVILSQNNVITNQNKLTESISGISGLLTNQDLLLREILNVNRQGCVNTAKSEAAISRCIGGK